MKEFSSLLGLAMAAALPMSLLAQTPDAPPFLPDARIMIYGDSITAQRFYTRYIEEALLTRYPQLHLSFATAGVGGDKVSGGSAGTMEERVARDVIPWHPSVVMIMLGMNDGHYRTDDPSAIPQYRVGYQKLIYELKAKIPGVTLILIQPSPYDEYAHPPKVNGYDRVLGDLSEQVVELGQKNHATVLRVHDSMSGSLKKAASSSPDLAGSLLPDRIHPSPQGSWLLAAAILKELQVTSVVSTTVLIPAESKVRVDGLEVAVEGNKSGTWSWKEMEKSLPLPIEWDDSAMQAIAKWTDLSGINQEIFRASGLPPGRYRLAIDGTVVGEFTQQELQSGVNLAVRETPMLAQAKPVDWAAADRAKISAAMFLEKTMRKDDQVTAQVLFGLSSLDQSLIELEWQRATPVERSWELRPIR